MSDDRVADALEWLEFAADDLDACRLLPSDWRSRRHPPDLERLSAYGIRARYPDNAMQVTPLESANAVRQAVAVMKSVLRDFERQGVVVPEGMSGR